MNTITYKLGEICKIVYGKGLPTKNLKPKGFPVFGANGIIGYYDSFLYEEEQVLISCRGAYSGKINISPKQCFITNNSLVITPKEENKVNKKYLYYTLQATNKTKLVTGTAQPQVTINNAEDLQIPLPPLPTQHAIVSRIETLFAELDKAVQHLRTAQQQLKTYRQAVLNHWLNNDEGKWEMVKLGEVVDVRDGTHDTPKYVQSGIPFVTQKNITEFGISFSNVQYITEEEHLKFYERSNVAKNDILIAMIGANRGNATIVDTDAVFSIKNVGLIKYKPDTFNNKFLLFYLRSQGAKNYIKGQSKGGAQEFIGLKELRNFPVLCPPLAKQQRIVKEIESRLSQASAAEASIENALQQAEALRQSILKKAFSGELV